MQTSPLEGTGDEQRKFANYHGHHTKGRGFPIQRIREWEGKLLLGQWETRNFGPEANYWQWVPIDTKLDRFDPTTPEAKSTSVIEYEDGSLGATPQWVKPKPRNK